MNQPSTVQSTSHVSGASRPVAKFSLGQVLATPAALAHLSLCGIDPYALARRHQSGDYGDLDAGDIQANEEAIVLGNRVLSLFELGRPQYEKRGESAASDPNVSQRLFVITEADRSSTTILIDREY